MRERHQQLKQTELEAALDKQRATRALLTDKVMEQQQDRGKLLTAREEVFKKVGVLARVLPFVVAAFHVLVTPPCGGCRWMPRQVRRASLTASLPR